MSSADQHGAQAGVLLAAGTAHYDCPDFLPLDKVPASLQTVVEALSGLGYSAFGGPPGYKLDPDRDDLEGAVHDASRAAPIVVIYYTGHAAHPERGGYYLVTRKSDADNLTLRGVAATQLAEALNRYDGGALAAEQPEVLIILDCCYSGSGGQEILAAALRGTGNENTWVIASAGRLEEAQQGLFAAAFADALQRPRTRPGQPYLSFEDVVGAINIALNARADQKARFFVPSGGASSTPRFLPNPLFQEASGMEHWLSLVRSGPDQTVSGFYLTGRTGRVRASEDLARWMADPSRRGLAVVTGSPGTGKSAVLALVVLLSLPSERAVLLGAAEIAGFAQRTADLLPPGTVSSSIHARRLLSDQVAALIAQGLDRHADSASALLEDLDTTPEKNSRLIVVDAVDEAASPGTLLRSLLVPLASQPGIKVVIGARRHVLHPSGQPDLQVDLEIDLDAETYQDPQALTDYVYELLIASHEPGITTPYQTAAGPGGGEAQKMVADVAAAIARRATARSGAQSFLIARLLALSVRARTEMVDTGSDWLADLPASVGAAFDQDLARLGDKTQVARILLEALAWANGPGLPWENVWIPVARALQDRDRPGQDGAVTDDDVRWFFNRAGAYITEDLGPGGRSVFRPFHDLLAVHLRGQPSTEAEDADPAVASAWRQHSVQTEQAVVGALLGTVSTAGSSRRDWISAHPYLRTYLAQHAKAAEPDTFPALVHDVDFLAVADPATLIPLLPPTDPELRDIARVYRRASPLLYDQPHANAAYLQEAAYALTGAAIGSDADITPLYRTTLAAARPDDSLLTIVLAVGGSPAGGILSVAFGSGAGGRTLLACGCADGTVRLWDPATGDPVGPPLTGHGGPVNSVAFSTASGPALLASGGEDGTVRLWDPATGNSVGGTEISPSGPDMVQPDDDQYQRFQRLYQSVSYGSGSIRVDPLRNPVATGAVKCVAFGPGTGPGLLAAGSNDQTVRVWDLATGEPAGPPLTGHAGRVDQGWQQVGKDGHPVGPIHYSTGAVNSVAFSTAGGTVLLASAGADGTVRLWNPATGEPAGPSLGDGTEQVRSVAFGTVPEHQQLLAAGGDHSAAQLCTGPEGPLSLTPSGDHHSPLRLWDAASGVEIDLPMADPDSTYGVRSVAFGSDADGRNLLASAGEDTTLRLWDPATGQPVGRPLVGHSERVNTVAFGTDGSGRALLASGSNDGTVRLWDPTAANHAPPPLSRQAAFICSVAFGTGTDGRVLVASADLNGEVQLWDPVSGTPLRPALPGGGSMVYGSAPLALGTASDGRLLLAFDSEHDGLRLWDLATEEFAGSPLTGHTGHVYSLAFGTGTGPAPLASGGEDGTVRRWDPATGDPIGSPLTGHDGPVLSVAFSAGTGPALLASAGMDGTVRLWNPATGDPIGPPLSDGTEQVPPVGSITGLDDKDKGPANARTELVAFVTTTGGRAIVASADAVAVRLWDPATAARLSILDRRSSIYCVAGAGALLAIGDEEGISVIELNQ